MNVAPTVLVIGHCLSGTVWEDLSQDLLHFPIANQWSVSIRSSSCLDLFLVHVFTQCYIYIFWVMLLQSCIKNEKWAKNASCSSLCDIFVEHSNSYSSWENAHLYICFVWMWSKSEWMAIFSPGRMFLTWRENSPIASILCPPFAHNKCTSSFTGWIALQISL